MTLEQCVRSPYNIAAFDILNFSSRGRVMLRTANADIHTVLIGLFETQAFDECVRNCFGIHQWIFMVITRCIAASIDSPLLIDDRS